MTTRFASNGVPLNEIAFKRPSLTFDEAVAVWDLHQSGRPQSEIAASLGTNQGRVNEVLRGRCHGGAEYCASAISGALRLVGPS